MLLQEVDKLMPEWKTTLALVKDAEYNCLAQFQKEMDSMAMIIKVQGERHAPFQNSMDSVKNMTNLENKRRAKFWDEMDSMKMTMERTPSMPMKQKVHHPVSKQSPIRMKVPSKT
jgi:hypothetical protein